MKADVKNPPETGVNLTNILGLILSKPEITIAVASLVIAAGSLFVALCALGVSIVNTRQTKKHYRLSVRPHLRFFVSFGTETEPIGIYLANKGIGPAILKDLRILLDGQPFGTSTGHRWNMVWMKAGYNKLIVSYNFPEEGDALSAGEKLPLLGVDKGCESDTERSEFFHALKRVDLEVLYESMYGGDEKIVRLQETVRAHWPVQSTTAAGRK